MVLVPPALSLGSFKIRLAPGTAFLKLVLPKRIELLTSPLPRECSTTELRQHLRKGALGAGL
jgi:hypothetical protein